jgi:hypothetical protein
VITNHAGIVGRHPPGVKPGTSVYAPRLVVTH